MFTTHSIIAHTFFMFLQDLELELGLDLELELE